ncbi:hypothetical protein LSM04_000044 [Trypanosoma melophagium]|uniref:uncharacterized protein n=1 Tax=Trypanosoma melophagium TaxID=715481 RepID=UPI00351A5DBA|nr:hypothetical protein LSM04_000044 [Trypanosoma melophagium]
MVALVHLDMLAGPAVDSPPVDSPRSLRACGLCGIDPAALRPLSLRQHFELLAGGAPWVDRSPPDGVHVDEALDACRGAGILRGSTQHKLQAYRNYTKHEAARTETLTLAREVRRQLIAEEVFERRRRAHADRLSISTSSNSVVPHTPEINAMQMPPKLDKGSSRLFAHSTPLQSRLNVLENVKTDTTQQNQKLEMSERVVSNQVVENKDNWPGAKHVVQLSPPDAKIEAPQCIFQSGLNNIVSGLASEAKIEDDIAVTRRTRNTIGDVAPPVPIILPCEQGEVFYYYCANAVAAGRVSGYREQGVL